MLEPQAPQRSRRFRRAVLFGLALVLGTAGCVGPRTAEPTRYRSPLAKLKRLLDFDFAPAARERTFDAYARALQGPRSEFDRIRHLVATMEGAWENSARRGERLPEKFPGDFAAEWTRLTHFWQRLPSPPTADAYAGMLAGDLDRVTLVLGLERRPLGEPSDREHHTDPDDDRPAKTWWQRLRRRILP